MKLVKDVDSSGAAPGGDVEVGFEGSICYDFVVSLRAMFNPRTFTHWRRWAAASTPKLGAEVTTKGEFLFGGFDTALGYGAIRLIGQLPGSAGPQELVAAVSEADPLQLALFMLDTGETTREQMRRFRAALENRESVDNAVRDLEDGWAQRCRRVLRSPRIVQADLVEVLETHWRDVYSEYVGAIEASIAEAMSTARKIVAALPPLDAIEQLTGGYTFAPGSGVRQVSLAASTFIAPFMSTRIDEEAGTALIIYGITSDAFEAYEADPEPALLAAPLKALSDPNRLTILKRLAVSPLYTTEILAELGLSQTTVHHHLAQLRSTGLVRQRRDRLGMQYSIRTHELQTILRSLEEWILGAEEEEEETR